MLKLRSFNSRKFLQTKYCNFRYHYRFSFYCSTLYCMNYVHSYRSSHRRCSVRKGFLRNFAKFTGKHLCQSLFFNKVTACNFIKKRLWHRCFTVKFAKFVRTSFLQNTPGRLLIFVKDYSS